MADDSGASERPVIDGSSTTGREFGETVGGGGSETGSLPMTAGTSESVAAVGQDSSSLCSGGVACGGTSYCVGSVGSALPANQAESNNRSDATIRLMGTSQGRCRSSPWGRWRPAGIQTGSARIVVGKPKRSANSNSSPINSLGLP